MRWPKGQQEWKKKKRGAREWQHVIAEADTSWRRVGQEQSALVNGHGAKHLGSRNRVMRRGEARWEEDGHFWQSPERGQVSWNAASASCVSSYFFIFLFLILIMLYLFFFLLLWLLVIRQARGSIGVKCKLYCLHSMMMIMENTFDLFVCLMHETFTISKVRLSCRLVKEMHCTPRVERKQRYKNSNQCADRAARSPKSVSWNCCRNGSLRTHYHGSRITPHGSFCILTTLNHDPW